METYIIKNLNGGECIVEGIKNTKLDVIDAFKAQNKPNELSDAEKASSIEVEIKKEEIKEYVKKLNLTKSNLKKIYGVIYGNCTESVQAMIKTDADYETKSKDFECQWLLDKVKIIVSGLDTKSNKRVSLHGALFSF